MTDEQSHPLRLMVTRPKHLAQALGDQLERMGFEVLQCPCIEIVDTTDAPLLIKTFGELNRFCALFFVSRNAVLHAIPALQSTGVKLSSQRIFAVGTKTAQQLHEAGFTKVIYPQQTSGSEALIAEDLIADTTSGEVLIIRGQEGNEALAKQLIAQGVKVTYAQVYKRQCPHTTFSFRDIDAVPDLILLTSKDSLRNLYAMTAEPSRQRLLSIPLLVGSDSVSELARKIGFNKTIVVAASPADADIVKAVKRWADKV